MHIPDANFWIALSFNLHSHHQSALNWFNALGAGDQCGSCRVTQLGFHRLATNPKSTPRQTLTMQQAWNAFDTLMLDVPVDYLDEPVGLETHLRQFTQSATFSHKVWNDAYLAAFAITGKFEIVTFDRGFSQYPGLLVTILP